MASVPFGNSQTVANISADRWVGQVEPAVSASRANPEGVGSHAEARDNGACVHVDGPIGFRNVPRKLAETGETEPLLPKEFLVKLKPCFGGSRPQFR